MIVPVVKLALALVALFGLAAFACAQPHSDHARDELRAFLSPPAACAAPCWQGIRPGTTRVDDAMTILDRHAWVSEVYLTMSTVDWLWNGAQPPFVDTSNNRFQGRMELADDTITSIVIQTNIPSGGLWSALGTPDRHVFMPVVGRRANPPRPAIVYMAVYDDRGLYTFNFLDCPINPRRFWFASNTVSFGKPSLPFGDGAIEIAGPELPAWFFRNQPPGCGEVQ